MVKLNKIDVYLEIGQKRTFAGALAWPGWCRSGSDKESALRGEIPTKGPRGGTRWTARYFVRRVAWHILDHAWEIEDRLISA